MTDTIRQLTAAESQPTKRGTFRRVLDPIVDEKAIRQHFRKVAAGRTDEAVGLARAYLARNATWGAEYWRSELYLVQIIDPHAVGWAKPSCPPMLRLRVYRHDGKKIRDHWSELQRIKNELVGRECQGVEIYPPERLLHDGENSYHLWVFKSPGVGLAFGYANGRFAHAPADTVPSRFVMDRV